MKIIGVYKNGNYIVTMLEDGTKIRKTIDDNSTEFTADFPENIDIKITNYCNKNCQQCHEDSNIYGKHANINLDFINTLKPYTEVALGGGLVTSHPQLKELLVKLRKNKIFPNITVHQDEFVDNLRFIESLINERLIFGLGISLSNKNNDIAIEEGLKYKNTVFHIINGIVDELTLNKLSNRNVKILILGFKQFRKGIQYYGRYSEKIKYNQSMLYNSLESRIKDFKVVSFDNLAIEQLNVRRLMNEEEWQRFYMGDDGNHTMYIDLVEEKFAMNSTSNIRYNLKNNIEDMFNKVRWEATYEKTNV